MTKSDTKREVGPEPYGVLRKPSCHPDTERNRRRRLGHLEQRWFALQKAQQTGEVCLPIRSAQVVALKPFPPASQGNGVNPLRDAHVVLIGVDVVDIELVVSGIRSGTRRSNGGTALRASDVDLPWRFPNDERFDPCRRYGNGIEISEPHTRESCGETIDRAGRKDVDFRQA